MRHSFQSRSLFLEARLLRFAAEQPEPAKQSEIADTIDEFRGFEKDGIAGPEKVTELDAKVKQVEADCKDMLRQIKERGMNSPKWKDMYDRYYAEMQGIHLKSPDAQAKIDALTGSMQRLQDEVMGASLKPEATLDNVQFQKFNNLSAVTSEMVAALRGGDMGTFTERYNLANEQLGGADPAVRTAFLEQYKVNREGTVVEAKDGRSFSFTVSPNGTLQYEILTKEESKKEKAEEKPAASNEAAPARPDGNFFDVDAAKMTPEQQEGIRLSQQVNTAVKSGDRAAVDVALTAFNHYAADMDPQQRWEMLDSGRLSYDGGKRLNTDGRAIPNAKGEVYRFYVVDAKTGEVGYDISYKKVEGDVAQPDAAKPEKGNDVPERSTAEMLRDMQVKLSEVLTLAGLAMEEIAEKLPKLMKVVEKHVDTIKAADEAGFTPENAQSIIRQPDLPSVIAEVQKIGAENGWTAELTEAGCIFFNDLYEAFDSADVDANGNKNERKPEAQANKQPAPGEAPKAAAADGAKGALEQIQGQLNKPKEMTEDEKKSIVDAGKKILDEYKKIDKPTKAQSEQARGQLMMAGVDATAGVDTLKKNPDGIKAKEGTEFQVTMNKVMGFVVYVMSILQEIRDTVKGEEEKKEGAERTKETARAEVDGHVEELKKFNEADELSASGNGAETLKKLNDSTAAYVKDFGGEADVTQSAIDGAGTLYDVDTNAFVTVAYDVETKTYSFAPVEGDAEAKPAENAEVKPTQKEAEPEESPEATREKDLAAAKEKTDAAIIDADATIDLDADGRRPALQAALDAIDAEIALMNEGELSSEDMVKRMEDLNRYKESYGADVAALDAKPEEEGKPADEDVDAKPEAPAPNFEQMEAERFDLTKQLDALNAKPLGEFKTEEEALNAVKERKTLEKKISELDAAIKELKEPKAEASSEEPAEPDAEQPEAVEPDAERSEPLVEAVDISGDVKSIGPK